MKIGVLQLIPVFHNTSDWNKNNSKDVKHFSDCSIKI